MNIFKEEYLKIIARENEVIEENKFINSLLAGASLFTSALLPQKISADTVDVSSSTKLVRTVDENDSLYKNFQQTEEELFISKFLYSQVKDELEKNGFNSIKDDIDFIGKTLATRFIEYKEGSNVASMIKKITSVVDVEKYEFKVIDKATFEIAKMAKVLAQHPEYNTWKDKSILFYTHISKKTPHDTKYEYLLAKTTKNFKFWSLQKIVLPEFDFSKLTEEEEFLARVLYSETSTICTPFEVRLICKVIMNRVGNKNFRNAVNGKVPKTPYDVVKAKNAFSCVRKCN